jgi:hypothetical protein
MITVPLSCVPYLTVPLCSVPYHVGPYRNPPECALLRCTSAHLAENAPPPAPPLLRAGLYDGPVWGGPPARAWRKTVPQSAGLRLAAVHPRACRLTVPLSHYLTILRVLCLLEKNPGTVIDPTPVQPYLPAVGTVRGLCPSPAWGGSTPAGRGLTTKGSPVAKRRPKGGLTEPSQAFLALLLGQRVSTIDQLLREGCYDAQEKQVEDEAARGRRAR